MKEASAESERAVVRAGRAPGAAGLLARAGAADGDARDGAPAAALFGWRDADEQAHHRYLWPSIRALLPTGERLKILDAGCGNGFLAGRLAALGHDVVGIDRSPDGLALARAAHPQVRFEVASVYADLGQHPAFDGDPRFDLVVASEVIEHLYAPRDFLDNVRRQLRPGGSAILTTPYHGYLKNLALALAGAWDRHLTVGWDGGHIKFFSPRTLARMLAERGFSRPQFANAGRLPWLWKSMCCRARRVDRP